MAIQLSRRARTLLIAAVGLIGVAMIAIAAMPVGWLKSDAEALLSRQVGRKVSIGAIERESGLSFAPVIRVSNIDVPQPAWAGPGKLATIRSLRLKVNTFAALFGTPEPRILSISGASLYLVRSADQRVNWRTGSSSSPKSATLDFTQLEAADATVHYRDAYQDRSFRIVLKLDPSVGFSAKGDGEVAANPVKLSASAPFPGKAAWPFRLTMAGQALDLRVEGTMAKPFDAEKMSFRAKARADDLKLIDRIIEAGLFGTQAVNLTANVDRDGDRWTLSSFAGTIGSSDVAGRATIVKSGADVSLDGSLRSRQLDFEDLASDAGNARAIALERTQGLRVVPNTRVNIEKVGLTKGRVAIKVDRLISARRPSALSSLDGVLDLDGKLLAAQPLRIGLTKGVITGSMTVDQREGRPEPLVTLAFDLKGSSISALFGGSGKIDAPIDARIRLNGTGNTIREAVGRSDGTIGLIAGSGSLPEKLAILMGFDIGRALFTDSDDRASLRCAAIRLHLKQGLGTASPLLVDTSRSQANGSGAIRFPDERLALAFTGTPKGNTVLRVPGSITVGGTIREPAMMVPRQVKSVGNVLKGIGRAITGRQGPKATDANCAAMRRLTVGG